MEYIVGQVPELGQVLRLYNDAGWLAYTEKPEQLMQALERSLYLVCAYEDGQLCGLRLTIVRSARATALNSV